MKKAPPKKKKFNIKVDLILVLFYFLEKIEGGTKKIYVSKKSKF